MLLFIAGFFLLVYVFLANFLVSQKYGLVLKRSQLHGLSSQGLIGDGEPDIKEIMQFAEKTGMVEAKNPGSLVDDSKFAISKSEF